MLIKSIKLENIRSYNFQEIEFPIGSVLLSGDIGSGKSTILSSIEFALFGIKRGDLSGSALLKHGKKEGSVELNFEIDGKEIIIKRNLKRGKDDIKQDTGHIIIDGLKKEATAVELKSIVLELLGFSHELVSKGKDLVYRYTIYTPQEQMKEILNGETETRLDTLRRVFGIDKYKRVRENALIISKFLREKIKLYQGQTEDLEQKQDLKKQRKDEISLIEENIKKLLPRLESSKERLNSKRSEILNIEKNIQELNKLKKELSVNETTFHYKESNQKRNLNEIQMLEKDISKISEEVKDKSSLDLDTLKKDISQRNEKILSAEKQINEINRSTSFLEAKKQGSDELKEKIKKISQCPTCLQEVKDEHKMMISIREDEIIDEIEKNIKENNSKKGSLEDELRLLKEGLEKVRKKESELSVIKIKLINIEEKNKNLDRLKKENIEIKDQLTELDGKIKEINGKVEDLKDIEQTYIQIKKEYNSIVLEERKIEINKAELTSEKETISKMMVILEEEIDKKLLVKERLIGLKEKDNWINKHFVNLVATIEKHVMIKIHQEFNDLFKDWFNVMIEDEALNARLDDSFTPLVEQDGYETEFMNLSGGERTSLALAYRLSLNKVINDLITNIKMRDLIILDEPTDGFSTEQLDRVKVVLDQLNLKQVIIVSHESKIEGFVDNIIKIVKEDNISKVITV